MKFSYRGFYFYLGWSGFIIAFDFDFRNKAYDITFSLFGCRFDLEEWMKE